jgi:demethylmenaquinone methyltransferase / 2-methoxy-6-polyprenyl-1,4-benzoquinol methylase
MSEILSIFQNIAKKYDRTNMFLTLGYITVWYKQLARAMTQQAILLKEPKILDLCCGSGTASKYFLQEYTKQTEVIPELSCVDFSSRMLALAKERLPKKTSFFLHDITSLPHADAHFDTIALAFGYRNLLHQKQTLEEIKRVLKPSGRLFVLELTKPSSFWRSLIHSCVLKYIVPLIGKLSTGQKEPYIYLKNSIDLFSLDGCLKTVEEVGLNCFSKKSFSFGSCTLLEIGHK